MKRRRALLYAALALAAPVPAFALGLGGSASAGSLDAHASLDSCGIFEQQIVCKIDVGFNQVAGADRYTASVAAPNGSVADYGAVGPGGGSLWVPYAGDGTYTVTVDAWGQPQTENKPAHLVAADAAKASGDAGSVRQTAGQGGDQGTFDAAPADSSAQGEESGQTPSGPDQGTTPPTTTTPCEPPPPAPAPAPSDAGTDPSSSSASGSPDSNAATLGGSDAAVLQSDGQVPQSVTPPQCPDGSAPVDGTCCQEPSGP
jgi:hypothetical protein